MTLEWRARLRSRLPRLAAWYLRVKEHLLRLTSRGKRNRHVFTDVFERGLWGSAESRSGTGSTLAAAATISDTLPRLIGELGVRSILDAPCGDFHWMATVDLGDCDYVGADVVPAMIAENQRRYGAAHRRFVTLDIAADPVPRVDLILCRDCLIHLPLAVGRRVIANFVASGSRYLLVSTEAIDGENTDILTGQVRPLDLTKPPFRLPPPEREIVDGPLGSTTRRRLGLWDLGLLSSTVLDRPRPSPTFSDRLRPSH